MENTTIEWADHTFNPFVGCTKVSPGCDHCYAEQLLDKRLHKVVWGAGQRRLRTSATTWREPLKWNARHAEFFATHGRRQRVFCASLADVFDNAIDPAWRVELFELIAQTPNLDWLLLTKRIGNARAMLNDVIDELSHGLNTWDELPWPGVWLGATVVNQEEADRDIPKLLEVPARIKFLSMEPLLGPVDINDWLVPGFPHCTGFEQGGSMDNGYCGLCAGHRSDPIHQQGMHDFVDWVICGGESGPHARPMHPGWVRDIREQCAKAGVAFLFKQWGEWAPRENFAGPLIRAERTAVWSGHGWRFDATTPTVAGGLRRDDEPTLSRCGKKNAGRTLDGRTYDGFPELRNSFLDKP
ncbi:phage Gp37/Gp68 family protein [Paraburkholderia sp. CNPSo 3272]|uniref:phage Gp37/Gp68 family protein n=1 Tax=Paraburkholderia sp. CNPSo 3272 TaxID=2940931 RepID=UPI0020B8C5AD|nr:phage Gp37/Gp68 family protein [Paraburkholderia sp. CNPSo 3272]MCP3724658.1 phage Gp37/Gp68 family protein [Paraburkholderia sp. CNPSo 3272]